MNLVRFDEPLSLIRSSTFQHLIDVLPAETTTPVRDFTSTSTSIYHLLVLFILDGQV